MPQTTPVCTFTGSATPVAGAPAAAHEEALRHGKLVRMVLCLAAFLVMAEWSARRLDREVVAVEPVFPKIFQPDSELGGTLVPGLVHVGEANRFTINRWGFRGAEVPEVRPPGITRIAVLGDSTTAALRGIDDDSVWVARMATELNDDGGSHRYDAINAAVPGQALGPIVRYLDKHVGRFDPDIVLVFSVANDIVRHGTRQFGRPPPSPKTDTSMRGFLLGHSALARDVSRLANTVHERWLTSLRHDRLDDQGIGLYQDGLEALQALCRLRGWRLVLCTVPRLFGDPDSVSDQPALASTLLSGNHGISLAGLNDAFERYNDTIRRFADEKDIPLVDLDRIVPKREAFFRDALHFNSRGHALVARSVTEVIRALHTANAQGPETR